MSRIMVAAGMLLTILVFQNCQNTNQFSSADGLLSKSGTGIEVVDRTPAGEEDVVPEDEDQPDQDVVENEDPELEEDEDTETPDEAIPANATRYSCKVDSEKGNFKIGLGADQKLVLQKRSDQGVVCMTKNACESIIEQEFNVKKAFKNCKCKPEKADKEQVHHLSDAEVQAKVDALK